MRSIITYYGGKGHSWRRSIPHFPPHHTYVEPFGGAANVLLNKPPSPVEVYNDIDSNVVTIFRVLRDYPDELRRALELTPCSREEFVRCLGPLDGLDDVEKARRLIVRYRQVDRKSTRLNSSHVKISYAVVCLKKKNIGGV